MPMETPNLASAISRQLLNVSQNNLGSVQATSVPRQRQRQRRWPRSYGTEQRWPRSTQEAPYSHRPPAAPDVSDAKMTSLTDVANGRAPTCNTWLSYGFMMCLFSTNTPIQGRLRNRERPWYGLTTRPPTRKPWGLAPSRAQGSLPRAGSRAFCRTQFVFRRSVSVLDRPRKTSQ